MAYATSNPPELLIGLQNFRMWIYKSTDASSAVDASGYITDGYARGMRQGDIVLVQDTDASPIATQICMVTSDTSEVIDLSDGVAITATDTD